MKLGDFFVEIGIKTDKKSVQAIDEQIKALKELEDEINTEIKKEKELAEAQTEEQKTRIKKKYQIQEEIKVLKKEQAVGKASIANFKGLIKGAIGVSVAIGGVVFAIDRMVNRLAVANQKLMNFQHQTGINISTLNKYASANVSANPLTSIESTAGSLQNLAQNLWDIKLGRGDVSAFQELSYFSGQNVTPYGKSVEAVIESIRSALTKIPNDVQATNLIQRMGFSADDLQMLRMTREEFERTQSLFLSASQRKELEAYGKQLNIIHLQLKLMKDTLVLKIAPLFIKIFKPIASVIQSIGHDLGVMLDILNKYPIILKSVGVAVGLLMLKIAPLQLLLSAIVLIIDDLIHYFTGGGSVLGVLMKYLSEFKFDELPIVKSIMNIGNAVNNYLKGVGFDNLSKLLSLGALNPVAIGSIITDNLGRNMANNLINNNDNRRNSIVINTNNPQVATQTVTSVTGQNYMRGGAR